MNMQEAGTCFNVNETYHVALPGTKHLIIVAGAIYGSPAARLCHPNILNKLPRVLEFKHYRSSGGKFWTAQAGYEVFFCIPTSKIEMVPTAGYSYVPVIISGQQFILNVSGGTFPAGHWTDTVRQQTHTSVFRAAKHLKVLANAAVTPDEFKTLGIDIELPDEPDMKRWNEIVSRIDGMHKLTIGKQVVLDDGVYIPGHDARVLTIESIGTQYSRTIIGSAPGYGRIRVKRTDIDWTKTVELWAA